MEQLETMDSNKMVLATAEFFKVFGDPSRLRLLHLLLSGEKNVSQLADALEMSQSAVSHQLRVLRQNGLVKYQKEGKMVIYSLDDHHVEDILAQGFCHVRHKNGWE